MKDPCKLPSSAGRDASCGRGAEPVKPWELGRLRVGENGRNLFNGDVPFFWLGDTIWPLFQKCSVEDAQMYFRNRAEKGFNVIQAVLAVRADGIYPDKMELSDPCYWDKCEKFVFLAEEQGLYMALLPCWGSYVKEGLIDTETALRYADFLADRFKKYPNIIWLMGGDIRGSDAPELFRAFGSRMRLLFPDCLIGYHPFGRTSSSMWFHSEPWLDFNMFQSGHRRYDQRVLASWDDGIQAEEYFGEDNWRYVLRDAALTPAKPTVDGEPSYEWIVQGLHDPAQPYWLAPDVRRYAWWSVLAGAMGHTYGHNALIQVYSPSDGGGAYNVKHDWRDALHHEGCGQMRFLKELMIDMDFANGRPNDERLVGGQRERYHRISVFETHRGIICYDYLGEAFALDLGDLAGKTITARWLDPATGVYSYVGAVEPAAETVFRPVEKSPGSTDWALVLTFEEA